eukprot:SAG25_NODE_1323_length_3291_cov_3.272243_5_plen_419_part_00
MPAVNQKLRNLPLAHVNGAGVSATCSWAATRAVHPRSKAPNAAAAAMPRPPGGGARNGDSEQQEDAGRRAPARLGLLATLRPAAQQHSGRGNPAPCPMEVSIPTVELDTDHHVYQIKVQCAPTGAEWVVRRRFSEFIELRGTSGLPSGGAALEFPRKRWFGNKDSEVVADRRTKLEAWLSATVTAVEGASNEPLETFLEANHERLGRVSGPASRSNSRVRTILEGIPSMQGPGPATSSVVAETVLFCGQTLTRTNLTEVVRSEPAYAAGWICDGCTEKTSSSQLGETIYHGAVEPSNPLHINAFDLCERCAADIPAAERRYQQKVDSAAERERQRFRDEWQAQAQFDDLFGRRGRRRRDDSFDGFRAAAMLFPHSGRHGFDNITPDATVPTPDKAVRPTTTLTRNSCVCIFCSKRSLT